MANTKYSHIPNKPSEEILQALKEAFVYDPETGEVRYSLDRPREHFISDKAYKVWKTKTTKKPVAGSINNQGRVFIGFRHVSLPKQMFYKRSHLAWFLYHGSWPHDCVDHINQIRNDDRIVNLRCVSNRENNHNRSDQSTLGVGVYANGNSYQVQINHNDIRYCLGSFRKPSHARTAYDIAFLLVDPTASSGPNGLKRKDIDRAISLISSRLRLEKLLATLEDNHNPLPMAIAAE